MMARPHSYKSRFEIAEEKRNALYEVMFTIFGRDKSQRDMRACICGLPLKEREKIPNLCKELGIDPDEYMAELQSHGVFADVDWKYLTTHEGHPKCSCVPAYVLYHYLLDLCKKKGIHQYRTLPI